MLHLAMSLLCPPPISQSVLLIPLGLTSAAAEEWPLFLIPQVGFGKAICTATVLGSIGLCRPVSCFAVCCWDPSLGRGVEGLCLAAASGFFLGKHFGSAPKAIVSFCSILATLTVLPVGLLSCPSISPCLCLCEKHPIWGGQAVVAAVLFQVALFLQETVASDKVLVLLWLWGEV